MWKKLRKAVVPFFFPLLIAGIVAVGIAYRAPIAQFLRNKEQLKVWITSRGPWAPLAFFGLQVLQVIVFVIPGEIMQVAGGFIFGFWEGAALNIAGIAAGSLFNYAVGRTLGRPFVGRIVGEAKLARLEAMIADPKAIATYFVLFLIPGIPKDILCYLAGMGETSPLVFAAASMAARLPGIAGTTLMGSASSSGHYRLALSLLALSSLVLVFGIVWRKRLEKALSRYLERRRRQ
jgi:uncharacterized membrane protein YdjX (TVP38/TMEM64 family)